MKNKRSSILLKRLNELDRLANKIFSVQSDDPSSLQHMNEDFEQMLAFVKNLLSAEMASNPTKLYDLKNMSERVREIEAAFRGVVTGSGTTTTTSTIDHVDNVGDDDDDEDRASKCSCNKFNLQDEYEDDNVSDDLESTLGQDTGVCVDLVEEKKATPVRVFNNVLFEDKVDDDRVIDGFQERVEDLLDDMSHNGSSVEEVFHNRVEDGKGEKEIRADVNLKEREKKKKGSGFWKLCGTAMTGFVIGMFSMAWLLIESLEYYGYEGHGHSLTPT